MDISGNSFRRIKAEATHILAAVRRLEIMLDEDMKIEGAFWIAFRE